MIQHAWSILCTKSIVDPETKNMTVVEVIEQLNLAPNTTFPVIVPFQMEFVSTWYRSDPNQGERGTGRLGIANPDGTAVAGNQFAIDLTAFYRAHVVVRSSGIGLVAAGVYQFVVDVKGEGREDWQTVARIPLNVAVAVADAAPQQ